LGSDIVLEFVVLFLRRRTKTATRTIRTTGTPIITVNGRSRYFVAQIHVMLEGSVNVNSTLFAVPDVGTLPVPDQPEQAYWVTTEPATCVGTEACTEVPASNHPVFGVGEP
jgi:hypothetical protein